MGLGQAVIAVGVGFRKGCTAETLVELVRRALAEAAVEPASIGALATVAEKDRPPLRDAAARLGFDVVLCSKDAMALAGDRITIVSERAVACLGVPSVAEAAALAAAGSGARLLLPRISVRDATCAIARAGTAPGAGPTP